MVAVKDKVQNFLNRLLAFLKYFQMKDILQVQYLKINLNLAAKESIKGTKL